MSDLDRLAAEIGSRRFMDPDPQQTVTLRQWLFGHVYAAMASQSRYDSWGVFADKAEDATKAALRKLARMEMEDASRQPLARAD